MPDPINHTCDVYVPSAPTTEDRLQAIEAALDVLLEGAGVEDDMSGWLKFAVERRLRGAGAK